MIIQYPALLEDAESTPLSLGGNVVLFMVVWVLTSVMPVFQLFFSADLGVTDTSRHFVSKINPFNYNKMLKAPQMFYGYYTTGK